MRSIVHRNLDMPFQIFGLRPLELSLLCIFFVIGNELSEWLGLSRVVPFVLTLCLGVSLFYFRRSMGDFFLRRLIRFLRLPGQTFAKLMS